MPAPRHRCANRQSCRFGIVRLAALVPRPRAHLTRYHGVFAPNFKHRHRIVANPAHQGAREPLAPRPPPMRWMQRLKRVFHIDIERCVAVRCVSSCASTRSRSSRESSLISPCAKPTASTTPAHHRCVRPLPNSPSPRLRPCPDCAHGGATASLRLTTPPPPARVLLAMLALLPNPNRISSTAQISALAPATNPTTITPILPQQRRSAGCFSYPLREHRR